MAEEKPQSPAATFSFITLDRLTPNPYNARRFLENMTPQRQARFEELCASVLEKEIIVPLLVRPLDGDRIEIVAGERRYRAACRCAETLGKEQNEYQVPCIVRDLSDDDAFDIMIIENLQRDDLTAFETAQAFHDYIERHGNSGEAVAALSFRTGIPAHGIRRQVRLLVLPPEVLAAWHEEKITQSHAEMFTRLDDPVQILELLAACIRLKLSTRELAERIGTISPDLEKAFFDKADCQVCHFNSAVQSGLFADSAAGGKCGNGACFEAKQGAYFVEHWLSSKAAAEYGTRGFRFGHRMGQDRCEPVVVSEIAGRCRECDRFVSVLRISGALVSGYARTCTGPVACFDELYRGGHEALGSGREENLEPRTSNLEPAVCIGCGCDDDHACEGGCSWLRVDRTEGKGVCSECPDSLEQWDEERGTRNEELGTGNADNQNPEPTVVPAAQKPAAPPAKTPPPPPEETGPVYNASRGERFRKEYVRAELPGKWLDVPAYQCLRFAILSLVLSSNSAKNYLLKALDLPSNMKPSKLAAAIMDIPQGEALDRLHQLATVHVMSDFTLMPEVWQLVAEQFGVSVKEWTLSKSYLDTLTKSEIVRVGEEEMVGIWDDDKVRAYRQEHHKNKALLSLKKEELMDIILKSGAELKGRVPAEVMGARGK